MKHDERGGGVGWAESARLMRVNLRRNRCMACEQAKGYRITGAPLVQARWGQNARGRPGAPGYSAEVAVGMGRAPTAWPAATNTLHIETHWDKQQCSGRNPAAVTGGLLPGGLTPQSSSRCISDASCQPLGTAHPQSPSMARL